ncbi:hypothetical protein ACIRPK_26395 [Kitasatospora sp. NPDC101801]|uniref:hypothetical protein n=1 Tax=Kitasatospora sp. NPDC101801 TaxID=3364103 RepID=UPI00380F69C2
MTSPYEFRPTHVVPEGGLPTWESPDPARQSARLDPLLPVMLTETSGDWARVVCSNAWSAWVDGRLLVALPHRPPGTAQPLGTTADPRALLAALESALGAYRALVEQYADGRIDLEGFRSRSAGLRIGAVIDGPAAWLLDLDRGRWYYCEGAQLQTYATVEPADSGRGAP